MTTNWREMKALEGQRVIVTLQREPELHQQQGVLVSLDPEGEVDIRDDDGVMHYCWPALEISPSP